MLTKFGLKRRHLDLIHARFDDFGHISVFNTHIFLCSTHTICLCATETAVSVCHTETAVSVCHTETAVSVWRTHTAVRAGGRRAPGAGRRVVVPTPHPLVSTPPTQDCYPALRGKTTSRDVRQS